jgi:predicted nucleic-acid-binding Zn-ribbon protein
MKKKNFCIKCGHKGFTFVRLKDCDILICKKCGYTITYNKEDGTKSN